MKPRRVMLMIEVETDRAIAVLKEEAGRAIAYGVNGISCVVRVQTNVIANRKPRKRKGSK